MTFNKFENNQLFWQKKLKIGYECYIVFLRDADSIFVNIWYIIHSHETFIFIVSME